MQRSDAHKLYGTDQPPQAVKTFRAGPVSLELEGGAVRYIRHAGFEAIRGIDYLVRDDSWRTPPATLTMVREESGPDGFLVELDGEVRQDTIHYRYRLVIRGTADGRVELTARGEALSSFMTNRTGFVVLHPIRGVAGAKAIVTGKDGRVRETVFPELISPGQPIFDIRSLRHEVAPGLFVDCLMEASLPRDPETIFEMEDQRNWTDASYKTYVCSLLDPWPFEIKAGQTIDQRILVSFEGDAEAADAGSAGKACLAVGEAQGASLPLIGMGLMPHYRGELANGDHPAHGLKPAFITAFLEADSPERDAILADYAKLAGSLGAQVQLELVLPNGEPPARVLAEAAGACKAAGLEPVRVIALPRPYLRSVQPVGPWPEVVDLAHICNKTREAFPKAHILGGMLTDFTEFNRKRPPVATVDGVSCTTNPIVHAADDRSVIETNETVPFVIASLNAIAAGKSVHLGPSAIGMRFNANGAATAPNPEHIRVAMTETDPRQAGLFAAAWAVGYAAAVAGTGLVSTLALNHLAGPAGVCTEDGRLHPVYHVMAALCRAGGKVRVPLEIAGGPIAGLAWRDEGRTRLLLANGSSTQIELESREALSGRILDIESFEEAAAAPDWSGTAGEPLGQAIRLKAYATLFATV